MRNGWFLSYHEEKQNVLVIGEIYKLKDLLNKDSLLVALLGKSNDKKRIGHIDFNETKSNGFVFYFVVSLTSFITTADLVKLINESHWKYFENEQNIFLTDDLSVTLKDNDIALSQSEYHFFVICWLFVTTLIVLIFVFCCFLKNKKKSKKLVIINIQLVKSLNCTEKSLKKKQFLLKEIHHRVKNNLQMAISMLNIQARYNKDITIKDFLEKGETRISVLALIHENLSEYENHEQVSLQDYLGNLVANILKVYDAQWITVSIDTESILMDVQSAITLGLIINELVSNSIKHGFQDLVKGEITIRLKQINSDKYELFCGDNGKGIKSEKKIKASLGLNIVESLVLQLQGTIKRDLTKGIAYIIYFKYKSDRN